ncbi:hypothetical protein A4G29_19565 [Mycobacterium kansasii]|nr:hypothetical protein A4G29_19565 [Mycobacterium kansasii]
METFILSHHSYLLLPLLTATGIPVPEEVVTVAAGVLSSPSVGRLQPGVAILACLAGCWSAIARCIGSAGVSVRHIWGGIAGLRGWSTAVEQRTSGACCSNMA